VGNYLWFRQQRKKLGYDHLVWDSLCAKYGPVVGTRLGRSHVVVVSGYDAVRDILLREEFEGRPDGFFFRLRTFGKQLGNAIFYHITKHFDKNVRLNHRT
jgi:methyl farnesoate epoxidase/farnesoate epoxidase